MYGRNYFGGNGIVGAQQPLVYFELFLASIWIPDVEQDIIIEVLNLIYPK